MAFGVQRAPEVKIVVLRDPANHILGLAHIDIAFGVHKNVNVARHGTPAIPA
jgi:hypothetical protein